MAGKLPNRPRCPAHPYELLQRDGSCFLCRGARLAVGDLDRRGQKRSPKFYASPYRGLNIDDDDSSEVSLPSTGDDVRDAVRTIRTR